MTLCTGRNYYPASFSIAMLPLPDLKAKHVLIASGSYSWRPNLPDLGTMLWPRAPCRPVISVNRAFTCLSITGLLLQAKHILIATGGRSWHPNIPGAELCIDSDRALELPACPKKITIIGGGYIGVEFAGIFKRFGTEVHVVVRQSLPLGGFDMEVRAAVDSTNEVDLSVESLGGFKTVQAASQQVSLLAFASASGNAAPLACLTTVLGHLSVILRFTTRSF